MFQLDDEVRRWRKSLEVRRWFSHRELDELEDHVRVHAAEQLESGPTPASSLAFDSAVRDEIGEPAALRREFARSEMSVWRHLLLTGWGLYVLSLLLPGFGIVAFATSPLDLGMSASASELLRLALTKGWILALLPNLAMAMTLPALGRARRRRIERWLGCALAALGGSALGFGVLNLLRPLAVTVDGDHFMYGHLGPAYWVWSASFALVAAALWLRDCEWVPARAKEPLA